MKSSTGGKDELKNDFFALLAFLVLIDGASKLIEILEGEGLADEFFLEVKKKIEDKKYSVMSNRDEFIKFLDDLTLNFAEELKKR